MRYYEIWMRGNQVICPKTFHKTRSIESCQPDFGWTLNGVM